MEFMEFLVLRCERDYSLNLTEEHWGLGALFVFLFLSSCEWTGSVVCCNRPIFLEPNRIWN